MLITKYEILRMSAGVDDMGRLSDAWGLGDFGCDEGWVGRWVVEMRWEVGGLLS